MAKKIEKFMDKVCNFIFDMICISCFVAGGLAFFFLFIELFFDGSINFLRRNLFDVFAFAIAFGVTYPTGKIFWKRYKRKLRKAQRELEMRKAKMAAELGEEEMNNV